MALLTFLGLHAETNPPNYEPTLASEFRRSLYAWVYGLDMSLVSFTGRPPLLSSEYASTPLPLDLSTEELISGRESAIEAVRGLDADGWGTQERIYPPTVRRARVRVAMIREEILRSALGHEILPSLDRLLYEPKTLLVTFTLVQSVLTTRFSARAPEASRKEHYKHIHVCQLSSTIVPPISPTRMPTAKCATLA